MGTKSIAAFIISFALLAGIPHADDGSMLSFCQNYLNVSQNVSINVSANIAETPAANESSENKSANFTYGQAYKSAKQALEGANASMAKLKKAGLPSLRAQDSYMLGQQWFEGQAAIESAGGRPDYGFAAQQAAAVNSIVQGMFSANDELYALATRFNSTEQGVNLTIARQLQSQAGAELADGRSEEAVALVGKANDAISAAESDFSRSNTLLESARKNIEGFLQDNWQNILITSAAAIIVLAVFQRQIRRLIITARMKALASEKAVLEGMIKGVQRDYFEKGSMNELSYRIKTKKFSELIRNINRQVPLLKEELKKV